ncbi:MAG: hypothetical protein ABW136_12190 [Steroidobacteraceae bacterium]
MPNSRLFFLFTAALLACPCFAQDSSEGRAGVSVQVRPGGPILAGSQIRIEGLAPVDGRGPVTLGVKLPDGRSQPLSVNPAANGDYSIGFSNTDAAGRYEIQARSPAGSSTGRGSFEVVIYDEVEVIDRALNAARQEAAAITKALDDIARDIDGQIPKLPASPAKDELKTRWETIRPLLRAAVRDLGEIDAVVAPLREFSNADPGLKPLLRLPAEALEDWTRRSAAERKRIVAQLDASRRSNVTCEQLERVIESFRVAATLIDLMLDPFKVIVDPLKDLAKNLGTQVGDGILQRLHLKSDRQSVLKSNLMRLKSRFEQKVGESNLAAAKSIKGADTLLGKLSEGAAWLAGKAFDAYCERFSGPFDGDMRAEFFAQSGEKWWDYRIQLRGQLELRYAKGTVSGAATRVNGEFTGQAVNFTLWEDAIRIGFPKLMASARLFKRSVVPKPWLAGAPLPNEDKPVEIEGKGAAVMVKPYGFSVPVQGELVDDVLTLRFQAATHDYEANARVVYVVVSPLSLVPVVTAFELPYKEAGFFFLRVSGGQPVKLKVSRGAKAMHAGDVIETKKGNGRANGSYKLKLDLCNPAGKC